MRGKRGLSERRDWSRGEDFKEHKHFIWLSAGNTRRNSMDYVAPEVRI